MRGMPWKKTYNLLKMVKVILFYFHVVLGKVDNSGVEKNQELCIILM